MCNDTQRSPLRLALSEAPRVLTRSLPSSLQAIFVQCPLKASMETGETFLPCRGDYSASGMLAVWAPGGRLFSVVRAGTDVALLCHRLAHLKDPGRPAGP